MKLILLGAPGAGKGTQAAQLSAALKIPTISTGDIIREAIRQATPLGTEFKSYTEKGKLVPDSLVVALLDERMKKGDCQDGFILDGFPRTLEQAEYLNSTKLSIDRVVNIAVPDESIVKRMSGRRFCPGCQKTYHTEYQKPRKEGICDACGTALTQRKDDLPETVLERLAVYHEQTEPLIQFYQDILITVDGNKPIPEITAELIAALKS